ncbi:MAG: hypothetical protein PVJ83_09870, partial [Gammaproteobacteria bacterium]
MANDGIACYRARQSLSSLPMTWSIDKARRRYNIATWSSGYFDVNAQGRVVARPQCIAGSPEINLHE